jgi:adenine-specific DNA-methyltransferase
MSKYDDLVKKLKEIFQIDKPELDFGVYRILNARVVEINDYLENRLKAKVQKSLAVAGAANSEHIQKELIDAEKNAASLGVSPDNLPKILELRQKLAEYSAGTSEHENAVFTHLLTFFSRYYDSGDFISQRRYKGDTYAIPYAGEEVMLHWANKDQYYTKSGENFSNYAFKLDDGRIVRFRLIAADTAKDNRKDNDKERRFVLIEGHTRTLIDDEGDEYEETLMPLEEVDGELVIRFEYKVMVKGTKQEDQIAKAVEMILEDEIVKTNWLELATREPTESNPKRTLLEKCLVNYTSKNTADYFIHKDLGLFLRGELDFYIKNEVMNLDDVQHAGKFADIEKNLRLIQTLRSIALELVTFLAQLEDFQKKLWLKKKFVVATNYCITLDRIPEALYASIAANEQQWEQWEALGMLDGNQAKAGNVDYLKAHPFLMADTALFDLGFKYELLATIDNLDESLDGLLINADNFQALNFLQEKYKGKVKSIYIDPPYNTDATEILYKNGYKSSSWISLMSSRIQVGKNLLSETGLQCTTIDDFEFHKLRALLSEIYSEENILGVTVIKNNPSGRSTASGFSIAHEYAIFAGKSALTTVGRLDRNEKQVSRYDEKDDIGNYEWVNFRKHGGFKAESPKSFFPIFITKTSYRVPKMQWNEEEKEWGLLEEANEDEKIVLPIDDQGNERRWKWGLDRTINSPSEFSIRKDRNGELNVYIKSRMNEDGMLPLTWWDKKEYSATSYGTNTLIKIFGKTESFSYPKSIYAVLDTLKVLDIRSNEICLDYFAGSGTTGHAVIALNREDDGNRRYILVEQGDYFDTVTKPRIQKVVYSTDWKDGKSTSPKTGISQSFKVLKLESYEDTLNNLQLRRSEKQQDIVDSLSQAAQDDYLLRYMLDIESRGSLLSVEQFNTPFDCKLKVAVDSAGAYEERPIDMVETFNYLIGLRVKHIDMQRDQGFVSVIGTLPTGEKTLVLWRDVNQVDYSALNKLCDKLAINPADNEFDIVYINGDHNIPSVFTATEADGGITKKLALRQIEPEFLTRMFAVEVV